MKVSKEKAAENRRKIVDAASRLFREKGFEGAGVAALMQDAGLTHGGFYGHFASKDDLAAEACAKTLAASAERWARIVREKPDEALAVIVRSYLSPRHRDNPGDGCAYATLGPEAARQNSAIRRSFSEGIRAHAEALTGILPGRSKAARREKAIATLSGMVGALVLARAVDDAALSDEILNAAWEAFGQSNSKIKTYNNKNI
jgi:TetR/AcrR family transcriptional repressor of nem operon